MFKSHFFYRSLSAERSSRWSLDILMYAKISVAIARKGAIIVELQLTEAESNWV